MRKRNLMILLVVMLTALLPAQAQTQTDTIGVIAQRFEGGEMIYREDTGTIYTLANARSADTGTAWIVSSSAYGNRPDNALRASDGVISPEAGFGQVWANNTTLRNTLGWATTEQVGYDAQIVVTSGITYIETLEGIVYAIGELEWTIIDDLPTEDVSGAASIDQFTLAPEIVTPGETLTVSWAMSGEDVDFAQVNVSDPINGIALEAALDPGESTLALPTSGTLTFDVPRDARGDLIVRLSAVEQEYQFSFIPLATDQRIVPLAVQDQTYTSQAAYQDYQNGFMVWLADTRRVFVLLEDGSYIPYAESDYINATPFNGDVPDGFVAPINAFGRVYGLVQGQVGSALSAEQGYTTTIQQGDAGNVTYTLPDGNTVRLDPVNLTWANP